MVANDYSAAAPVPVCDILLKIGAIMWFCDFYLWCDIFYFLWFEFTIESIENKFMSGMYHAYSQF